MRIRTAHGTVLAVIALLSACEGAPAPPSPAVGTVNPTAGVSLDGVPVVCGDNLVLAECRSRADVALNHSLEPPHPPVVRIVVTCDAERCDEDEGSGQVIVHFNDGTRYVVDIGFGRTTN